MVEGFEEAPAPAPRAPSPRSPLLFAIFVLTFTAGAVLASLALAAALYFVGLWAALAVSVFVAVGLPLFLVLRIGKSLRARGLPPLARHLVAILLAAATHAALFGVCLDWVDRSAGDVFLIADALVDGTVGELPLLSGILNRGAEDATISLDGKPRPARDGGPAAATGDGGSVDTAPSGEGAIGAAGDGGAAAMEPSPLSARSDMQRPVGVVVSLARTNTGGYAAVVTTLDAGGATQQRALDLTPFASEGGPTAADAAKDGGAAFVTGGGSVVYAGPKEAPRALPALSRGAKLSSAQGPRVVRAVRDVAIAPGGALLAVADIVISESNDPAKNGTLSSALLSYHPKKPTPVVVLRQGGDVVPGAADGSVASGFGLRRTGPAGRVTVVEAFLEGGEGASSDERLLAGRVDEGSLLQEVARTGDAVVGLPQRAVSRFEGASVLADGRVLFGASFVEQSAGASLLLGRAGQPPEALAADAVLGGKAPWSVAVPAAPHLVAEPDGRFSFVKPGAGVVLAEVDRPLEATLLAPALRVLERKARGEGQADGAAPLGGAAELFHPTLSQGGDWLLVGAKLDDGRRALLLLSRADVKKGVAEVLLVEGGPLPEAGAKPKAGAKPTKNRGAADSIRSLMLYDWRASGSNVTSP